MDRMGEFHHYTIKQGRMFGAGPQPCNPPPIYDSSLSQNSLELPVVKVALGVPHRDRW